MSLKRAEYPESQAQKRMTTLPAILWALVVLVASVARPVRGENPSDSQNSPSPGHRVVILLDVNSNQKKVLAVELSFAENVHLRAETARKYLFGNYIWLPTANIAEIRGERR